MIKTVLLIFFLIIVSFFSGRTLMLLAGVKKKSRTDFFSSFTAGSLVILCVCFLSHVMAVAGGSLLAREKKLDGIIMIALMTLGYLGFIVLTLINSKEKKEKKEKEKQSTEAVVFCVAAVLLSVITFIIVVSGSRLNTVGDETLETVVNFLGKGTMYTADPLTGLPYTEGLSGRVKILCLPGMYAVMSDAFATAPGLLVHHIMPGFWFMAGLFGMVSLSGVLFSDDEDRLFKRSAFVLFALVFVYASDLTAYAQGFGILSQMWTGNAIRVWVLIPFMMRLLFDKKYILAFLPVFCEAFICRTQYGIGFCAFIYAGFIIVSYILRRLKRNV